MERDDLVNPSCHWPWAPVTCCLLLTCWLPPAGQTCRGLEEPFRTGLTHVSEPLFLFRSCFVVLQRVCRRRVQERVLRPLVYTVLEQRGASPHDNFIVLHGLKRCAETSAL